MLQRFLPFGFTLLSTICFLDIEKSLPRDYSGYLQDGTEFDVIIIGAGAAGCVLSNRLAENENMKILLLEAGGYPPGNTEIPGLFVTNFKSEIDWSYDNEPTPNSCLGYNDQRCTTVSGKVLGGSTSINAMLYTRALPETYDNWSNMGNRGWDSKSLQKYYNMFEGSNMDSDDYGKEGPMTLTPTRMGYGENRVLIYNASKELGVPWHTGNGRFGLVESYTITRNKRRCSSAKSFLAPIKLRPNLFLSLNTLATKILFKENMATGVKVKIGNKYLNLVAKHEVIISAGTIETPKLLMLSGIGPKAHLESKGIRVHTDLPVGKNYQDHFLVPANIAVIPKSNQGVSFIRSILEYCVFGEGSLGESAYNIQWFIKMKNNTNLANAVIKFLLFPRDSSGLMISYYKKSLNINDVTMESLRQAFENNEAIQFTPILASPVSRGEVMLKSKDPNDKPKIFGNYLSDPNNDDLETMLETIEHIKLFLNTPIMRSHNMKLYRIDIPNCRDITYDTRDYWICFIRNLGAPSYHPVGTCKMAQPGDPSGVVTPDLKIVGLDRIRVIDASIMPEIVDRNPISAINVIAHKGADLVVNDWMNKNEIDKKFESKK